MRVSGAQALWEGDPTANPNENRQGSLPFRAIHLTADLLELD